MCRVSGCEEEVAPTRLMCHRHWFMVPAGMKTDVNDAYARYRRALPKARTAGGVRQFDREEFRRASAALSEAQNRATHYVENKLAERVARRGG